MAYEHKDQATFRRAVTIWDRHQKKEVVVMVEAEVDLWVLCERMASAAYHNKTKKATLCNNTISVSLLESK